MPTIIYILGWRVFFYSDERNEPMHVHCRKGGAECKYWIRHELFEIEEAWAHGLTPRLRREIRQIIFDHFDVIVESWNQHMGE